MNRIMRDRRPLPGRTLLVLLISLLALTVAPAQAQNAGDRVTVIVLDQSGSMDGTDPLGLRCSAVRLLADLATEQDTYGLIRLASTTDRVAQVEIEPRRLGYQPDRDAFRAAVRCDTEGNTPIADSLRLAYEMLADVAGSRGGAPFRGQVLLLTDGAPAPDSAGQIEEIRALLPSFQAKGWTIDTVGLQLRAQNLAGVRELLQEMVDQTGGAFLGDVGDPSDLQPLFVGFFARQSGRTSVPERAYTLASGGEEQIQIPAGTRRIDILVSKDDANASLTLVRDDGQPISRSDSGVELFSTDDPYYTAISLVNPTTSRIFLRSDRPTSGVINLLTTTDLTLSIRQSAAARPANQPVDIEVFFARSGNNNQPVALTGATVSGSASIDGSGVPLQFVDDGSGGDTSAGDGIYTARVNLGDTLVEYAPRQVDVAIEGVTDGQRYYAQQVFDIVPVPDVQLIDPDGVFDVPGGAIVEIPLRLDWRGAPVGTAGWSFDVIQASGASRDTVPVAVENDRVVVTIAGANALENAVTLSVTLRASTSAGLQTTVELPLTIRRAPGIQLYWDVPDPLPLGREVAFSAGLILDGGIVSGVPLRATVERDGGGQPPIMLQPESTGGGVVAFSVTPDAVGTYIVRVTAEGQALQPVERTLRIVALPKLEDGALRPCGSIVGTREQVRERYRLYERAREVPVLGWIFSHEYFTSLGQEPFALCGRVQAGDADYTGAWIVELRDQGAEDPDTVVQTASGTGAEIRVEVLRGISGEVEARFIINEGFDPTIGCCTENTALTLTEREDYTSQVVIIVLVLVALITLFRWFQARRYASINAFEDGDVLIITRAGGAEQVILIEAAQPARLGRHHNVRLNLDGRERTHRIVLDSEQQIVFLNGQQIGEQPEPVGNAGYSVSVRLATRDPVDGDETEPGEDHTSRIVIIVLVLVVLIAVVWWLWV